MLCECALLQSEHAPSEISEASSTQTAQERQLSEEQQAFTVRRIVREEMAHNGAYSGAAGGPDSDGGIRGV